MKELFSTSVGRLRIVGLLEGVSLLILIFIAMPLKYWLNNPVLTEAVGPAHGVLFLLFVFQALGVGVQYRWTFKTTSKVLLACMIPFGTFYIDKKILSRIVPVEANKTSRGELR